MKTMKFWIVLVVCMFLGMVCVKTFADDTNRDSLFFDFSTGDTSALTAKTLSRCKLLDSGLFPSNPRTPGWTISLETLPEFNLIEYPYMILDISPDRSEPLSVSLNWSYHYRESGVGTGHIDIKTGILDISKDHEIIIDLRRSAHGVLGQPDAISIVFKRSNSSCTYPVLKSIQFKKPQLNLLISERLRRLTSPNLYQQPFIALCIISILLVCFICLVPLLNQTLYRKQKISLSSAQKAYVSCLVILWFSQAGASFFKQIETVPELLWIKSRRAPETVRENVYGEWCRLIRSADQIVPKSASVGIVSTSVGRNHLYGHLASYLLYPRHVSESYSADYLLLPDYHGMNSQQLDKLKIDGYHLCGAAGGRNFIFSKHPPQPHPTGQNCHVPQNPTVTVCSNSDHKQNILDGDQSTRWSTGHPMQQGDWIQIDLASPQRLSSLRCWHYGHWDDYPRGIRVDVSRDGATWLLAAEISEPFIARGYVHVPLPGTPAHSIKITQTRSHPGCFWSVSEIELFTSSTAETSQ